MLCDFRSNWKIQTLLVYLSSIPLTPLRPQQTPFTESYFDSVTHPERHGRCPIYVYAKYVRSHSVRDNCQVMVLTKTRVSSIRLTPDDFRKSLLCSNFAYPRSASLRSDDTGHLVHFRLIFVPCRILLISKRNLVPASFCLVPASRTTREILHVLK